MGITRRSFLINSVTGVPALMLAGSTAFSFARSPLNQKADPIEAETMYGKVRGYTANGVSIFRGIPYGGPTEGLGRFMPPSKPANWTGVRDATQNGPRAIQHPGNIFLSTVVGEYFAGGRPDRLEIAKQTESENCLNLNVLTPGLTGKRPVMVYIHGGGFSNGSGLLTVYSDRHVREQDVVLVGMNHRLNVFGYLYLGGLSDRFAVGNPGQLDLVAALEWVRDNISRFGGDPANVTIFGESGGGAKISTLLAMPSAKGLFHKAAIQSGSLFQANDATSATKSARDILTKLGVHDVADLQKLPADTLLNAVSNWGPLGGSPVIDGHSLLRHPWDPDAPEMSESIPLLIGNDKDESTLFKLREEALFTLNNTTLRAVLLKDGVPENKIDSLLALYRKDYPAESPSDLYFRISTDRGARWNAVKQAELQATRGKANVFMYYFQWNTPLFDGKVRAFHTADLPLAMRLVRYPEAEQLSRQLSGAWAAFARSGSPGQKDLPWPAYTTEQRGTMVFDISKAEVVNDPDHDERLMIRDIPSKAFL